MCGEMDEEADAAVEFYNRFVAHTHSFLANLKVKRGRGDDALNGHLDAMMRELLRGAIDEKRAPLDVTPYQRLAMEPLVLARIAGFMAAHLPLSEDPLKSVMEALMLGYSEGEIEMPDDMHDHGDGQYHTH